MNAILAKPIRGPWATALLLGLLHVGCALPRSMVGLDTVLEQELGSRKGDFAGYRCTRGAHRGDSILHMENSLAAVQSARNDPRFAFIEFDVQYTGDNQVVVFHDKRLLRVFRRLDKVATSTYHELAESSEGEIATYEEVMDAATGKRVNVEIKSQGDPAKDKRMVDFIVADARARRISKQVLISSISPGVLRYVRSEYPEMATGQIFWIKASTYVHADFLTESLYRQINSSGADYLMLHTANLRNIQDLLRLKPRAKSVVFWGFDDTMYLVHKDLSDRLWGDSLLTTAVHHSFYKVRRPFAK